MYNMARPNYHIDTQRLSGSRYTGLNNVVQKNPGIISALVLSVILFCTGSVWGALTVDIQTGYNLVVDSNVTAPSTYAPDAAFIGAEICNTDTSTALDNVFIYVGDQASGTPGLYPVLDSSTLNSSIYADVYDTGNYSITHQGGQAGISDATRFFKSIGPGECRTVYWLISYPQCVNILDADGVTRIPQSPPCDTSITGGIKDVDDITLDYDVWATADVVGTTIASRDFTMRNEISAAANKIWPNTTAKVPTEYLDAIQSVVGWGTIGPDGQPLSSSNPVYPGQRVITTQGIWYDMGNVGEGFDNDGDLIPDHNLWMQPVGNAASFDPSCFRLVRTYGLVIVKRSTGDELIPFENQLYFEHVPKNTGVTGLVYYQFIALREGCTSVMTPYQEAASGWDNEKFCADFGVSNDLYSGGFGSSFVSKTDGVDTVNPTNTLTYTVTATNDSGVNLGAPELGVPLVFRDAIPAGTTYVGSTADDALVKPTGTGSYLEGYVDNDDNLDTCTINYRVDGANTSYIIYYSNDNGITWSGTESGTVTDIQWQLFTIIDTDGSHDGVDCVAPDGIYDDGRLDTSIPGGVPNQTISVQFQVTVDTDGGPIVCNTAVMGFGNPDTGTETTDCTLVTGDNTISGTVFVDGGTGTATYGDGIQNNTTDETGIGAADPDGVIVTLYYDVNGDGKYDVDDVVYGTTTTDANGDYSFTLLPDGPYLVEIKKYDGASPDGSNNAVIDFYAGLGNTTTDPNLPTTTDHDIIKMTEDLTTVTLAVNVDLDHSSSNDTHTDVDFGFAPPLFVDKTISNNLTSVDEGDVFEYSIILENRLPSIGHQGPTGCEYTVWASTGATGAGTKSFSNPANAYDSPTPNRSIASASVEGGANRWIYGTTFSLPQKPGSITKVEGLFFSYFNVALDDDFLDLTLGSGVVGVGQGGITGDVSPVSRISTAQIESYLGEPEGTDPNEAISWDISTHKPNGTGAVSDWLWTDMPTLHLQVNPGKVAGADGKIYSVDAIGLRVTTDADCVANSSTTLSPVPLEDTYTTTSFDFISASPSPTSVNTSTGEIKWDDVGPILPGGSQTVTVTVQARDVDGTVPGTCTGSLDGCNSVDTNYDGKNVYYADGRLANDDSDNISVDLVGKGEIRGTVWSDANNDGWSNDDGESGLPEVTVTLFACMQADGNFELAVTRKTCVEENGSNTWQVIGTTVTDASGSYQFIGLDQGTYIVEVGDTDGAPPLAAGGGNSSPYGGTQTAEPNDTQAVSGGNAVGTTGVCQVNCNNGWGNQDSDLNTLNQINDTGSEETINGVDFGYYIPNATIIGNVWHDVDGDAVSPPEAGETGLSGFTVELYHDTLGDGTPDAGAPLATTTTDSEGNYSFSGLSADDYVINVVAPSLPNHVWGETHETTGGTTDLNNQIPVTVTAGQFSSSHDFGYTKTSVSSIGDTLYYDFNGDGNRDPAEQGIANVTVYLFEDVDKDGTIDSGVDTVIATEVTDANGEYLFADLKMGSYVVKVDTADADFPSNVTTTGDPDTNSASIGDYIWLDADDGGDQDPGEEGIPGVVVLLYEDINPTDGNLNTSVDIQIAAVTTDLNGNYLFTRLEAGNYFVDVDETTLPDLSLVRTTVDPASVQLTVTDRISTAITSADVGYSFAAASNLFAIGNRVWSDDDGDGVDDPGEGGMEGVDVTVQLTSCYPACATKYTDTTDTSGYYLVTGLANGTYTVEVDTSDISSTFAPTSPAAGPSNSMTITISGTDDMSGDFGYRYDGESDGVADDDPGDPVGKISGTVCNDTSGNHDCDAGEGMGSTLINLYTDEFKLIATTVTDVNGLYAFTGVPLGIYMVEAINTSGSYSTTFLASGSEYNNLDILYDPVRKATPDSQSGVAISGVYDDLTMDFGYQRFYGSIGDTVYLDVNENADQDFGEPGISGVTVELYLDADNNGVADAGELVATTTTSADDVLTGADEGGTYLFSNLAEPPAGQYYIIKVDESTIAGTPTLIGDPDTDGIPCPLLPLVDVPDDEYPPASVCDSQQTITAFVEGINYLAADFGYSVAGANHGIIGDTLWIDTNNDGSPAGESGISYVTVYLDNGAVPGSFDWIDGNGNGAWDAGEGDQWVETDISGYYVFTGLADGTYTVKVLSLQANDPDWPDDSLVAVYEAGGSLDNSVSVTISAGAVTSIDGTGCTDCELDADFGYRYAGTNSLSGTICIDSVIATVDGFCGDDAADPSGVNASETALAGLEVLVYRWTDSNADTFAWGAGGLFDNADSFQYLGNDFTDANGDYSFTNLPDDIIVLFTVPATDNLQLTTDNSNTSVEDGLVVSRQLFNGTGTHIGNTVTVFARQALDLSGDADDTVVDLDFTFDGSLGGTIAYDYGDLPAGYGITLLTDGGAQHTVTMNSGTGLPEPDLFLGTSLSVEDDGQESATASVDSFDDGVVPLNIGSWNEGVNGGAVQVTIDDTRTAPAPAPWLAAWMDFNNDGDFSDTGEFIISEEVASGSTVIRFDIPANGLNNSIVFARFRLFPVQPAVPVLSYKGGAGNGEVEDYQFNFDANRVIGDRVWLDEDADGFQDIGEPGIPGVTLELYFDTDNSGTVTAGDTLLGSTITDAAGRYLFENLDDGNYLVAVTDTDNRLAGLEITPGSTDPHDVTLAQNDIEYRDADFGYVPSDPQDDSDSLSAIGDFVWNDGDADGMQDTGELGISGVAMALVNDPGTDGTYGTTDDSVAAITTTDDSGFYLFTNVIPGDYVVIADVGADSVPGNGDDGGLTETPTTGPQSEGSVVSRPLTVIADKSDTTIDFGFNNSTGVFNISDRLWYDIDGDAGYDPDGDDNILVTTGDNETGLGGITVNLVKDSNGDSIADAGEPIVATVTSNADGTFTFSGVPSDGFDDYIVVISDIDRKLAALTATTGPAAVEYLAITNLSADVDNRNTPNFGYNRPGVIDGYVWSDADGDGIFAANESGISGVTVSLQYDSDSDGIYGEAGDDDPTETEVTDELGFYEFTRLGAGNYRVVVAPPAGLQTGDPDAVLDDQTDVTLAFGDGIHHLDFGYQDAGRYAISGTVFHDLDIDGTWEADGDDGDAATPIDNEPGIDPVTLYLYSDEDGDGALGAGDKVLATTQSAAGGSYSFTGLANDDYVVAVTDRYGVLNGYELTSGLEQLPVTLNGADVNGIDFGYALDAQAAIIGDLVWLDSDGDGIADSDEAGIANVTLRLLQDSNKNGVVDGTEGTTFLATTTTDASGFYLFDSVAAGYYFVSIDETTLPDTNLARTTGTTNPSGLIALSEYEEYLDADFGYTSPVGKASIGGTAWADMDNDGLMDPEEIGIAGVDINVWDAANTTWLGPVVTNPDGSWLLTNLDPGKYIVSYNDVDPALDGFIKTPPTNLAPETGYSVTIVAGDALDHLDFGFPPVTDPADPDLPGSISGTVYYDFSENSNHEPAGTDTISGTQDDEKGIVRVTLNLVDTVSGVIYGTVTTDADGDYRFTGIAPGNNYMVVIADQFNVLSLLNQTELLPAAITVAAGTENSDNDAGFIAEKSLGTIGNKVWYDDISTGTLGAWDVNEPGIAGVVVECWHDVNGNTVLEYGLDNLVRTETTDSDGEYYCEGIPTGNYIVRVVPFNSGPGKALYLLAASYCTGDVRCGSSTEDRDNYSKPNPFALTTASPNLRADFGFEASTPLNTISGMVFNDMNNNASGSNPDVTAHSDLGDVAVEDATVFLYRNGSVFMTTTTDAVGYYSFGNLADGSYDIDVSTAGTTVSGYIQTTQGTTNGIIVNVSVAGGQTVTDYDFGFYQGDIFPTVAVISSFRSYVENGQVVVEWETVSENGTVGFYLERWDSRLEVFKRIHKEILPSVLTSVTGGIYSYVDTAASPGRPYTYRLIELEYNGVENQYGPWRIKTKVDREREVTASRALKTGSIETAAREKKFTKRKKEIAPEQHVRMQRARIDNAKAREKLRQNRDKTFKQLKILVRQEGLHALTLETIAEHFGMGQKSVRKLLGSNRLSMSYGGEPVHTIVSPDGNALLFFGAEVDSIFTDENVYWLTVGKGESMQEVKRGNAPSPVNDVQSFRNVKNIEEQKVALTWFTDDPRGDFWYWDYSIGSAAGSISSFPFKAEGASLEGQACLTAGLYGSYDDPAAPDHRVRIRVNNVDVGEEAAWDGFAPYDHHVCFDQNILNEGDNTIQIVNYNDPGVGFNLFWVDGFELEYQRLYTAEQNSLLAFGDWNDVVTVNGFGNSDIMVLNLDDIQQPKVVVNKTVDKDESGWRVSFVTHGANTPYLAVTPEAWITDAEIIVDKQSTLRSTRNRADHIIISPVEFSEAAKEMAEYRTSTGLLSLAVELEDIYDEFNYGIADPVAVRDFLSFTVANWLDSPRYVVLAGKGSLDYTDRLNMGGNNFPVWLSDSPLGMFASDTNYGDLNDDGVSEFAIGRLPVINEGQLRDWTDKLRAYETAPSGSWSKNILLAADNPDFAGDYHAANESISWLIPQEYPVEKAYLGILSRDEVRNALFSGFGNTGLINYFGHGAGGNLADEKILTAADVVSMNNGDRLPVIFALTCNVGMFEYPGFQSLSEALVLRPQGGAIAVFSPSGLSFHNESLRIDKALMGTLFPKEYKILGDALLDAQTSYSEKGNYRFMQEIYNLMGDPGMKLR